MKTLRMNIRNLRFSEILKRDFVWDMEIKTLEELFKTKQK